MPQKLDLAPSRVRFPRVHRYPTGLDPSLSYPGFFIKPTTATPGRIPLKYKPCLVTTLWTILTDLRSRRSLHSKDCGFLSVMVTPRRRQGGEIWVSYCRRPSRNPHFPETTFLRVQEGDPTPTTPVIMQGHPTPVRPSTVDPPTLSLGPDFPMVRPLPVRRGRGVPHPAPPTVFWDSRRVVVPPSFTPKRSRLRVDTTSFLSPRSSPLPLVQALFLDSRRTDPGTTPLFSLYCPGSESFTAPEPSLRPLRRSCSVGRDEIHRRLLEGPPSPSTILSATP